MLRIPEVKGLCEMSMLKVIGLHVLNVPDVSGFNNVYSWGKWFTYIKYDVVCEFMLLMLNST